MARVKICGITNLDDAAAAAGYGADAIGFIFWERSPRYINEKAASRILKETAPFITAVGVFVNETTDKIRAVIKETGINCVQLHGDEPPESCEDLAADGVKVIKAFRVREKKDIQGLIAYPASAYLLDTYREGMMGGTGETFNWDIAVEAKKSGTIILSGGLTPENVSEAVKRVGPYAVDVSSGVEISPGRKDPDKVRRFIKEAKKASGGFLC